MLRARLITGLLYIGFVFWAIFSLSPHAFIIANGVLCCFLMAEWLRLVRIGNQWWRILWVDIFIICLFALVWWDPQEPYFLYAAALFWGLCLLALFAMQRLQYKPKPCKYVLVVLGFVLLVPLFDALSRIRFWQEGQWYVLMLFVLLWSYDTLAYVSGRIMRGPKLAPFISPGKTWSGAFGGCSLALVALLAYHHFVLELPMPSLAWYGSMVVLIVVATAGDLFESVIKRMHDVKDSGSILPGHGGLLDRFDSLIAVAPIFVLLHQQGWL